MSRITIPIEQLTNQPIRFPKKLPSVIRALNWCEHLIQATQWEVCETEECFSLRRVIQDHCIELKPLEAACLDLGVSSPFAKGHLPILLNGEPACVRPSIGRKNSLHTDMVASMILLLGGQDFLPAALPKTLHKILTDEQLATLPPSVHRRRTAPGQPSTTGRVFLDETLVTDVMSEFRSFDIAVQFEKRDGTLRNMQVNLVTADDVEVDQGVGGTREARQYAYNPADYHLIPVVDLDIGEYRFVAIDRVTRIEVNGIMYSTDSSENLQS